MAGRGVRIEARGGILVTVRYSFEQTESKPGDSRASEHRRHAMRFGKVMAGGLACVVLIVALSGCVSIEKYRQEEAARRHATAQIAKLQQDLQDARDVTDNLNTRARATERELDACNELLVNLRTENDLLTDALNTAKKEVERLAGMEQLGDLTISGPKLPQQLDTALQQFAQTHPGEVIYDAANGRVKWKSDLLFALGSDVVRDSSITALRDFSTVLKSAAAADFEVLVIGHTDSKPITSQTQLKHPTNWHLSAHRAISVARVLLDAGYSPDRVAISGCSEYRPVGSNATETGATQNRRVEIYLVPLGSIVPRTVMMGESGT